MSYTDKICNNVPVQRVEHHSNSIPNPVIVNYNTTCSTNDCNCDPIYSYQSEPIAHCDIVPMGYAENSIPVQYNSAKYGISDPSNGLNQSFIVGLGLEPRVRYDSLSVDTQYNLIPWHWLDFSAFDPSLPFTPKEWDYEGLHFSAPTRNRLIITDCNGIVIKDITAPVLGGGGGGFSVKITDTQPLTDYTIPVIPGQTLQMVAGPGINLDPINGGLMISNSAPSAVLALQPAPNSGIVVTGGSNGVPYTLGIDCGTLRSNCGLVRSVNGSLPDSNGNVSVAAAGGSGLSAISNSDQTLSITYPSTGVVGLDINCANLKAKCNFVQATNVGVAGQFLQNNGNGTATWVDLPLGGNPSGVVAPTNAKAGQSAANGGAIDGSTTYSCGNPLLSWTASAIPGVTYEIRDGSTVLATGIAATKYQTI